MNISNTPADARVDEMDKGYNPSRRRFFQLAGGIAGAGMLFAACHPRTAPTAIYVGTGDVALLNFLYILEQLEADFYTKAVAAQYYGMPALELQAITDVRDQEVAHREFLKTLLGKNAIPAVKINFSNVNFSSRDSVLTSAAMLEDIVIAGFNGASALFKDQSYPLILSKIASVECRHSAYFRDVYAHNTFSDSTVVDANGLSPATSPTVILASVQQFITTQFDSTNLPHF